jgi:Uma2 family endonuclease
MERGVPELWIVDASDRAVEVWRPGASEPEVVRESLAWIVAGHRFAVILEEVFRA